MGGPVSVTCSTTPAGPGYQPGEGRPLSCGLGWVCRTGSPGALQDVRPVRGTGEEGREAGASGSHHVQRSRSGGPQAGESPFLLCLSFPLSLLLVLPQEPASSHYPCWHGGSEGYKDPGQKNGGSPPILSGLTFCLPMPLEAELRPMGCRIHQGEPWRPFGRDLTASAQK